MGCHPEREEKPADHAINNKAVFLLTCIKVLAGEVLVPVRITSVEESLNVPGTVRLPLSVQSCARFEALDLRTLCKQEIVETAIQIAYYG